jgi:spermidine synthase
LIANKARAGGAALSRSATEAAPMKTLLWLGTAAIGGAILMGLEMVGFRLYAPYFGYSIYVWGSMISVILAAMACGYWFGGQMADRSAGDAPLYTGLLVCAAYQLSALLTAGKLLTGLADLGEFEGAGLATVLVFGVPVIALAAVGPFVVRLLARSGRVGSAAGAVSAVSTLGSILGILVTTYYFVPAVGTQATLRYACAATALLGAAGLLAGRRGWRAAVASALLAAALTAPAAPLWLLTHTPEARVVWTGESPYNLVRVLRHRRYHLLQLNDDRTSHSMRHDYGSWTGSYHDMFAVGPLVVPGRRLVVLGLGAGSSVVATRLTAPEIDVDAVEIDPKVVEAGMLYFGLERGNPRFRLYIADARRWLAHNRSTYDIAHVDLFEGGPYVPFYLSTVEFFRRIRERLSPDGLLMDNVFDPSATQELLKTTAATMARLFPSVFVLSDEYGSHMLLGFVAGQSLESLREKIAAGAGGASGPGVKILKRASSAIKQYDAPAAAAVFTDDHAPIEGMTRRMITAYYRKVHGPRR